MSEPIPRQIGSVEFGNHGRWVTVRCPPEFGPLMRRARGKWDPDKRYWLIHVRHIDLVIRVVRRVTTGSLSPMGNGPGGLVKPPAYAVGRRDSGAGDWRPTAGGPTS